MSKKFLFLRVAKMSGCSFKWIMLVLVIHNLNTQPLSIFYMKNNVTNLNGI